MKVCVTSTGPSLDSEMDPRFGRCQYFLFVDPESLALEAVENPNLAAAGGAGIQSAQFVANKGVEAIITGQVGPNAFTTLQAAGLKILIGASGKVREVLEKYKKGQLSSFAQGPSVQAHYGMGMGGGMGRGMGRGMGMGMGMGRGISMGPGAQSPGPPPAQPQSPGQELEDLREQSKNLRAQLDQLTERIKKLETKK
jgi:predicted Fe-Mo cluster-binding NifX family protein